VTRRKGTEPVSGPVRTRALQFVSDKMKLCTERVQDEVLDTHLVSMPTSKNTWMGNTRTGRTGGESWNTGLLWVRAHR
jgi:hypothetical protein